MFLALDESLGRLALRALAPLLVLVNPCVDDVARVQDAVRPSAGRKQRSGQRAAPARPEVRIARDDDLEPGHTMRQESTRSPLPTRRARSAPPPPSR